MFAPRSFKQTDVEDLIRMVDADRFASLVVCGDDGPVAAHAPLLLKRDEDRAPASLIGHVARTNPLARFGGRKVLAIFRGADAYISAGYYPSKAEHGRVVPTWNYVAVEARGSLTTIEDTAELKTIVSELTDVMEQGMERPWSVDDAPSDYVAALLRGIIGVRIEIETFEGVRKLSQNKTKADHQGVVDGLKAANHAGAADVAALMMKHSFQDE